MALVILGGGVAEASGSLGGITFSHNRGGNIIRRRTIPVNPNTAKQAFVRTTTANLANRWVDVLTVDQRIAWNLYAENTWIPGPLGNPRNVGGLGMYVRSNVSRLQAGVSTVIDDAPTSWNLGGFTPPVITSITAATDVMILAFTNTDEWAIVSGGFLFIKVSPGQNNSRFNYFGRYNHWTRINGAVVPPTSPFTTSVPSPFNWAQGQRVYVKFRAYQLDGRLSAEERQSIVTV